MKPINTVCATLLWTTQILSIQVGMVAFVIPPSTLVLDCAVIWPSVVVFIFGGEGPTFMKTQRVTLKEKKLFQGYFDYYEK